EAQPELFLRCQEQIPLDLVQFVLAGRSRLGVLEAGFYFLMPANRELVSHQEGRRLFEQVLKRNFITIVQPAPAADDGLVYLAARQLALNMDAVVHAQVDFDPALGSR